MIETEYMTEVEAAQFTRFAKGTLRNMRSGGRGPKYLKMDKAIRYRRSDLVEWLEAQVRGGTTDQ